MKKIGLIIICLLILSSCTSDNQKLEEEIEKEDVDITIGYQAYPSSYVQALLVNEIINRKGYSTKMIKGNIGNIGEGVDVFLSGWFPERDIVSLAGNTNLNDLGVNTKNYRNGLFVPKYVSIGFIEELTLFKNKFNKTIYICEESDITLEETKEMISDYAIDYKIKQLGYKELEDLLDKAIKDKEWIAIALWTPNGYIDKFDLRVLEDTKRIYTNKVETHTIISNQIENENVINILDQYNITQKELNELLNLSNEAMYEDIEMQEVVAKWLDDHQYIQK